MVGCLNSILVSWSGIVSRVMSMRPRDDAVMAVVLAEAVAAAGGDPEAARLFVVAESLDELANCAERGEDPSSSATRAGYAAELTRREDPDLITWPPGRNQPCWCGAERKYKTCCARPRVAADAGRG
jgi:hypothetical protein